MQESVFNSQLWSLLPVLFTQGAPFPSCLSWKISFQVFARCPSLQHLPHQIDGYSKVLCSFYGLHNTSSQGTQQSILAITVIL